MRFWTIYCSDESQLPIILKCMRVVAGLHPSSDWIIAHGQDSRADPQRPRNIGSDCSQPLARTKAPGAFDMDGKIAIAELEPRFTPEFGQRCHKIPAFIGASPSVFRVTQAAKCVDDCVDIR